ncbi:MAG: hypothetical protein AB1921_16780 [Thermodesulfobacteriota bacterium]
MKIRRMILSFLLTITVFFLYSSPLIAEDDESPYPKHVVRCIEAMNYCLDEEKQYVELMSAVDVGEDDCAIEIWFKNEEKIKQFDERMTKKGLDPGFVTYQDRKIKLNKGLGEACPD